MDVGVEHVAFEQQVKHGESILMMTDTSKREIKSVQAAGQ
jgi:hypothetical protein